MGTRRTRVFLVSLVAGSLVALTASSAQAADFSCDASALRIQLGNQTIVEPLTANRGGATCQAVKNELPLNIGPIAGSLLAQTSLPSVSEAVSQAGLPKLTVGAGLLAGLHLPTLDAIDSIPSTTVAIPVAGQLLGLPSSITIDVRPAVKALVNGALNSPLLEVDGSFATARASCVDSKAVLSGESQLLGLSVLGQKLPLDAIVQQAVNVYDGQTIDLSKLDLSQIVLPPGLSFTDPLLGTILQGAVKTVLSSMPPITLPASVLQVALSKSSQELTADSLTQRGLQLKISLLGQNLITALVGEARMSASSISCAKQAVLHEKVQKAALQCTSRRLTLLNVLDRGDHVALLGAADRRLAGKRIAIYSKADHRVVARPRVSKTGLFHASAPLPPARDRYTNTARYMAVHGKDRSLNLKLHRRMYFTSVRFVHGKVQLRGVVTQPRLSGAVILLRQRVTCHKQIVVARLHPDAKGRFRVVVKPRGGRDIGVYRATTMVAFPDPSAPDFRTYTLPGLVSFAG
jgi:hypothetical protein